MALRIVRSSDPITVDRLNLCLYAQPGIGKTSLAFTASRPLLLDFDKGAHRAANRKDIVQIDTWADAAGITSEDVAEFDTIIIDTAGRALDVLATEIIRKDPKKGYGGALNLQGYGQLKSQFIAFMKLLNGFGKDVVLIAHMDEQRNGDEIIERLDVQGGSKGEIYKASDAMGRIVIHSGKRMLLFSPTDASFGKNPGQLDPLLIPNKDSAEFDGFLAGVIQQIKDRLNELTAEQAEAQAALEKWRLALADVEDVAGINVLLSDAKDAPKAVKALIHARAKDLGLVGNKKTGEYEAKQAA